MSDQHNLTALQLAIVRVLWDRDEATVTDIWEALHDERGLAHTTLATMLSRLERKGVVTHRTQQRQFIYRALVTEQEVQRSMVSELTSRLFKGDVSALVRHVITTQRVSSGDRRRLRQLLDDASPAEKGT